MPSAGKSGAPPTARPDPIARVPPQGLFVLGAIAQYLGSSIAVLLFADVPASGVAWVRVTVAAATLLAWRRPWQARWSPRRLGLAAAFGVTLAAMNLCFYLAIDRLPLGTSVAIEFWGPIAVAALGSRTRRDVAALGLVAAGILLLADVRLAGSPAGVAFALAAGGLWGLYVLLGHRLASDPELRPWDGLAAGAAIGAAVFAPFLVGGAGHAVAAWWLAGACIAVGLLSSVVPYALEQLAMRRLARARFALLLALLPATAVVVGAVVLGQIPRGPEVVGIAAVIAAAGLRTHEPPAELTEGVSR